MSLKRDLIDNIKNIYGWKTPKKIVVFSVDDYGNVRLDSKIARAKMDKAGVKALSRFDALDTLETREDLEILFETLTSVKDKNGKYAVFTPFALPCNIDFERMAEDNYQEYHYELLPETYSKLKGYTGTWNLWQEGIKKGLMAPQFHGREHFNLKVFEEKLASKDHEVMTSLKNRSYTSISSSGYSTISVTAAFEFWDIKENDRFDHIIKTGLDAFEKVFGYPSTHFNAPGASEHPVIHKVLKENGIKYIDTPWIKPEHQGLGIYKRVINFTGKNNKFHQNFMVRNVVFEPMDSIDIDWVNYTLRQIETAFRWHRPAIISSHRVNFCGHIDQNNRKVGIKNLKNLLQGIVKRWPDVEFMSTVELGTLITETSKR